MAPSFEISRSIELDAGHRVPFHDAGCRFLHGHRYKVIAFVTAQGLAAAEKGQADAGMVVDFGVIKRVLMDVVHAPHDHKLLLWRDDPLLASGESFGLQEVLFREGLLADGLVLLPCIPTAECLAEYWGEIVARKLVAATGVLCPRCKGDGCYIEHHEPWANETLACPDCEGEGKVPASDGRGIRLTRLQVQETPTSVAEWAPQYLTGGQHVVGTT